MAWTDRGTLAARDNRCDPSPLDEFLVSGGDGRLKLSPDQENAYGCTPFPAKGVIDFASSTASSISPQAYERARLAREELLTASLDQGPDQACEAAVQSARLDLLRHLKLDTTGTDVVFSASGTDAQLQTLLAVRLLNPGSLSTVIVGADQTGSGTTYTSRGRHFSQTTSTGTIVEKGAVVPGLEGIENLEVGFRHGDGDFRSPADMDQAVYEAVEQALAKSDHVLLQAMEASKFGWKAPSDDLLDQIMERWPNRVQIVADACQLRISRTRLQQLLSKNRLVLITGSKFFTGPAFSGGLLVPHPLAERLRRAVPPRGQLAGYATRFDWPKTWSNLRNSFSHHFNFGQWLRWQAALEEMRLYYAVPTAFRVRVAAFFDEAVNACVKASDNLCLLDSNQPIERPTIFPILLRRDGHTLDAETCAQIYRAMRRDLSHLDPKAGTPLAARCQIGQPVTLGHGKAALRVSLSARIVRDCWSANPLQHDLNLALMRDNLCVALAKLQRLTELSAQLREASA